MVRIHRAYHPSFSRINNLALRSDVRVACQNPKTYQNRIKTVSLLIFRIKTLLPFRLVGVAVQLGQGFPFHPQFHLRVLLEDLRVGLGARSGVTHSSATPPALNRVWPGNWIVFNLRHFGIDPHCIAPLGRRRLR